MSHKLPTEIIQLDELRINRNIGKECTCWNRKFMLDTTNKRVICSICGVVIDPYDALYEVATKRERFRNEIDQLLEQRKQILDYKPHLITIRKLEQKYRGKKMLPNCPRCEVPFYLEEINMWTGREYADARIKRWQKENED